MYILCRFDIRVMQSGRMKGQAFVGLPSEAVAEQALQETNGYMLQGKPIVVVSTILFVKLFGSFHSYSESKR